MAIDRTRQELADLRLDTQADVQRLWQLLMQPLGFASTSVWVCFTDDRGALVPPLVQVSDDLVRPPTRREVAGLVGCLAHLVHEDAGSSGIAVLLSRPGRGGLTCADRRFAGDVLAACRAAGVRCHPIHVADDHEVMAVTPDDLAAA